MFQKLAMPPFFKEIFLHLPHALLDLISWKEMLTEVSILSNRLITKKDHSLVRSELENILFPTVQLNESLIPTVLTKTEGAKILQLYFNLLMKGQKIFLDLRPKYFGSHEEQLSWNPNNLWAHFDPLFQEGIQMIYRGYYYEDDQLFHSGLLNCKLIKAEWPKEQQQEVSAVFKTHFSNGLSQSISFNLTQFRESFGQIFKTLLKNKITLDKNFLYLGVMLVTLYITLDEIGGEYDVASIFKENHKKE